MTMRFKVGDMIKAVYPANERAEWPHGLTGEVIRVDSTSCLVRFDTTAGDGHGIDNRDWWVYSQALVAATVKTNNAAPSAAADLRLTPQAKTVLRHLKTVGDISPMKALTIYGYTRLASCIHEIRRKAGYNVDCEMRSDAMGHRYACYSLAKALVH